MLFRETYKNFLIRRVDIKDIDELIKLDAELFGEDAFDRLTFIYLLQKCEFFRVVEFEGRIVGYICGYIQGKDGYLASIALSRNFQGMGLGRYLLSSFEEYISNLGGKEIILEVEENNERAIKFYFKMGYRPIEKLERYYPSGKNALRMIKKIFNS